MKKLWQRVRRVPKKVFIPAILILVLLGWFFFLKPGKIEELKTAPVRRETVRSTVSASGILTGKTSTALHFKSGGKLAYLGVKSGDSVVRGQVVAALDAQDLSIALQQAENTLRDKEATVDKIHDDLKGHDSDETYTQRQTRTTAEVARDNAYDSVRAAKRAFQDVSLVAPISGIVTKADFVVGQNVSGADVIAQIVDPSQIYFDADIDEGDIGKISLGQKVDVVLNAYPERAFTGSVEKVYPTTKTATNGATVVAIHINLGQPGITLINGLNGQASVVTSEVKNVLSIPQDALREDGTVLVLEGRRSHPVKVTEGLKSDLDVEIKEGLTENEEVIINPQAVNNSNFGGNLFSRLFRRGR